MLTTKWALGIVCGVTGLVTGYAAVYQMLQTINGGPWSWWYPIMLGASVLLLTGAVHALAPSVNRGWLVALGAGIPLTLCAAFGTRPVRCWIFAVILGAATWTSLLFASTVKRAGIVSLLAAVILSVSWVPISIHTFGSYLSPNPTSSDPAVLLPVLILWALMIATLVLSGIGSLRSSS
jgi:hypothetical protein